MCSLLVSQRAPSVNRILLPLPLLGSFDVYVIQVSLLGIPHPFSIIYPSRPCVPYAPSRYVHSSMYSLMSPWRASHRRVSSRSKVASSRMVDFFPHRICGSCAWRREGWEDHGIPFVCGEAGTVTCLAMHSPDHGFLSSSAPPSHPSSEAAVVVTSRM